MSYVPTATTLNTATSNLLILNSKSGVTYDPEPDYKDLTLSGAATTRYSNLTVSNGGVLRLGKVTVDNVEVYTGGVMRAATGGTWYTVSNAKVYAGGSAFGMYTAGATLAGADTYFALGTLDGYKTAYTDENGYLQNFGCGGAFSIRDGMKIDNFTARSHLYMQGKAVARNVTFVSSTCNLSMLGGDYVYNAKMADSITHIGTIRLAFSGISLGGAETNFVGNGAIQWNNGKAYGSAGVIDANIAITNGVITGMKLVSSSTWLKDITLCEGIQAHDPVISSGGVLRLYNGGIASAAQVNATGAVNVSAGGLLSGASVIANATVNVYSGGVVSGGEFAYGAYLNVSKGGLVNGASISGAKTGQFTQMVRSGGTVTNCLVVSGALQFFDVKEAVANPDRELMYCRNNTAASGGSIFMRGVNVRGEDITILPGAYLGMQNGARVDGATLSGGTITITRNSGTAVVDSGARASIANVEILSGGTMQIIDADADRIDITSGWVSAGSSAVLTNFRIYAGGSLTATNNPVEEVDLYNGGRIYGNNTAGTFKNIRVSTGGTAYYNGKLDGADVRDGYLSCTSLGSGAHVRVSAGIYCNRGQTDDVAVRGGTVQVFQGNVSSAVIYAGTLQAAYRGTVNNVTVSGGILRIYDSLNSNGTRDYEAGPIWADGVTHSAGTLYIRGSNAGMSNAEVYGNNFFVENGATVSGITIFDGGEVTIRRQFGNYVETDCEAVVSGAAVKAGGKLTVTSGAVCDLDAEAGASVTFSEYKGGATLRGGKTTFAANTLIYNGSALGAHAENGTIYDLGADGVAYRLSVGDDITVQDAFVGDNWRISAFGTAVLSGLRVTGTTDYASVIMVDQAKSYDAVLTGGGTTTLLAVGGNATAYDTVVNAGGTLRFNAGTGTMSGSVINADGTLDFNNIAGGSIEDTTLMAGAKVIKLVAGANTGSRLTVDFTTGNSISVNDLSAFSADTTVFVKGIGAAGTYTLGQAGTLAGVTCVDGLYSDAVATGATFTNAVTGFTYSFDGAVLTAADAGIGTVAAAAKLADGATTINNGDKAAKWDATTTYSTNVFLAEGMTTGNAWLDIDGFSAAANLFGTAKNQNFAGIVNIGADSGTVKNLAAGAGLGGSVAGVKLTVGETMNVTGAVYAGGMGDVTNETETLIAGGTFSGNVFAGALCNYAANQTATNTGDISLTVKGGTFGGNIYAGAAVKAGAAATTVHTAGDITVELVGGTAPKQAFCVYGGGYATGTVEDAAVYEAGDVAITVAGGEWGAYLSGRGIFGGAYADKVAASVDSVAISVTGGKMGNVYGGGWAQNGGTSTVAGKVSITIDGDAEVANVFGGGSYSSVSFGATRVGRVEITVAGGNIVNNIFAGGQGEFSTIDGDVSVSFTGSNDYSCSVYGYTTPTTGSASPNKALNFADFTGAISGNIGGFTGIVISGDTAATLSGTTIDNGNWEFDFTERTLAADAVALTLEHGISTAGDLTLTLRLAEDVPAADWSLATGVGDISGALSGYEVYVGDDQLEFVGGRVVSGDYAGWGFDIEDTTLKFKHLA